MSKKEFSGIIAYTITPFFRKNDQINLDVMFEVIDDLIGSGANAIAGLGSAGECAYLNDEEWQLVARETIKYVADRVPVIIGISELTTKKAVERAIYANKHGADAIMVSPFSYYKLTEDEIFDHYQAISDAIDIPIMVYNNPATCGVDMSPTFMLSMIEQIDHAEMIKESTGDIQRMHQIHQESNGSVPFFNGCNYIALEAINAGAQGWCTVAPSLIGDLPKQLFDAIKAGQKTESKALFYQQLDLLEFIVKGGLASTVKAGLEMKGIDAGDARLPLKPLPESKRQQLHDILKSVEK